MVSVSVVIPAKNEEGNIVGLVDEIRKALEGRFEFEIIYINDGSTDATLQVLQAIQQTFSDLRIWSHVTSAGQSRAVAHGVRLARFPIIATLDADGQNDPANIPEMIERLIQCHEAEQRDLNLEHSDISLFDPPGLTALIAGNRTRRKDTWLKRISSKLANAFRAWVLRDNTPDTGCGLKVFYRDVFLRLPFFDHMHRYLPALVQRQGYKIQVHEVNHRHRQAGTSKYGFHNRLWVGIIDIFGVMWLLRRCKNTQIVNENKDRKN